MNKRKRTITFNAPAVLWFVILCFGAMILNALTGGLTNRLLFSTYRASLLNPLTWLRLFTHVLGHVSWQHFIGNMTYILLLGPMLEEKYGWKRLVGVMAVTAGVTGVVHTVLFPGAALCGASGIVFAFILMTSFTGFREGELPVTVILTAAVFIGQQVYEGIFIRDNVSNLTHILGGVVGGVTGYMLNRRKR